MKYYLIAGEPSGDLQASYLVKELKVADSQANIRAFGGDLMKAQGTEIVKHYDELAFMGVKQVLLNVRTIFKNIAFCKQDIKNYHPDVLILIDYPGFNLRMAKWAKKNNIKVFYYISPKIWAWNQKRVHKIKKVVDKMFVILPFEKEFYAKFNYEVDFVGHPLLDSINDRPPFNKNIFIEEHHLGEKPLIAILPGSRKQEISVLLTILSEVVDEFPEFQFVIAGAPSQQLEFYNKYNIKNLPIIENKTYDLLESSYAALVASGTANLETALLKIPQVLCWKVHWLFYYLARMVIKVKYISLVNLIMDREVLNELIQKHLTKENITRELTKITKTEARETLLNDYETLYQKLGGVGASKRAAELMVKYLRN